MRRLPSGKVCIQRGGRQAACGARKQNKKQLSHQPTLNSKEISKLYRNRRHARVNIEQNRRLRKYKDIKRQQITNSRAQFLRSQPHTHTPKSANEEKYIRVHVEHITRRRVCTRVCGGKRNKVCTKKDWFTL